MSDVNKYIPRLVNLKCQKEDISKKCRTSLLYPIHNNKHGQLRNNYQRLYYYACQKLFMPIYLL